MADTPFQLTCPLPLPHDERILLAHGGGGRLMHRLLEHVFLPAFANDIAAARHDGAVFTVGDARLAFTTDAYVVRPLEFPGGNIGTLAINGTVNDLAMCGARPLYLSAAFILEEGFSTATLQRIVATMRDAAQAAGIQLVTGDTKVVDRGKGDGMYVTTAGIGVIEHALTIAPAQVRPGDAVLINGDLGRHGIAIMSAREGLAFESAIESDCAPLNGLVDDLLCAGVAVRCLRDLTRGGLASALVEIAEGSGTHIAVNETVIPVRDDVQGACELLGLDPLYVANEGRLVAFVAPEDADRALAIMRAHTVGEGAACIGEVRGGDAGLVTVTSRIGIERVLDMLSGEQLPRIC